MLFLFRVEKKFQRKFCLIFSTEIPVKQNQRKARVKEKPKKSLSDQIIEFQNKQHQQIRESEILSQEFMQQLIMQQREDNVRERERDSFLFRTQ